ncbi:MAG: oxidoreductase [Microbacteriaceae bacterium]|nr:oxidoreductase [Microbacteriaceae bacterium]
MDKDVDVVVSEKRALVPGHVVEFTLTSTDDFPLSNWEPGAHIEVVLPSGLIRHYSLCGDPADESYKIAVLREADSRGGSHELHDAVSVGTRLVVRGPRNHFPLQRAAHTVFIAGGIGITPLLPMMRALTNEGRSWELHYGGKSLASLAYLDALDLMEGHPVNVYVKDETRRIPVADVLEKIDTSAIVYVCGPDSMISDVENEGARRGLEVRLERFGPTGAEIDHSGDTAFEVVLNRSGSTLTVTPDQRLIDVVRTVVPSVPFSCEEGYCGSCETTVLEGEPEHRDSILSPEERASNECMMICVGRSRSSRLVLDI